jgi:dsRNA-specific ribonuclease
VRAWLWAILSERISRDITPLVINGICTRFCGNCSLPASNRYVVAVVVAVAMKSCAVVTTTSSSAYAVITRSSLQIRQRSALPIQVDRLVPGCVCQGLKASFKRSKTSETPQGATPLRSQQRLWKQSLMTSDRVDLPGAEAKLGYRFSDRSLGEIALNPSVRGFSRLEFLGDSILGVVVFTLAELARFPRPEAQQLVSNRRLRQLFNDNFAVHSPGNTGDVIEALVGAVYLDAGFERAANLVSLAIEPQFGPFDQAALSINVGAITERGRMWIGAHTSGAVIADHLCTSKPNETHEFYSKERSRLMQAKRLAKRARKLGLATADHRTQSKSKCDEIDTDALDAHVAALYLRHGWQAAKPGIRKVIGL